MREIAQVAQTTWDQHFKTKLYYVAGYNKAISYLTRYMPARPQGLIDFNAKLSPAINMRDFHKRGAVFILTTDQSGLTPVEAGFPLWVKQVYPRLIILPEKKIQWARPKQEQNPFVYQLALLPPQTTEV